MKKSSLIRRCIKLNISNVGTVIQLRERIKNYLLPEIINSEVLFVKLKPIKVTNPYEDDGYYRVHFIIPKQHSKLTHF